MDNQEISTIPNLLSMSKIQEIQEIQKIAKIPKIPTRLNSEYINQLVYINNEGKMIKLPNEIKKITLQYLQQLLTNKMQIPQSIPTSKYDKSYKINKQNKQNKQNTFKLIVLIITILLIIYFFICSCNQTQIMDYSNTRFYLIR